MANLNKLIFSFVVPVYNAEKYIAECIDSLVSQNIPYEEYEIICVDDGSCDKSGEILDAYAKKFKNITIIHKENAGVSSARNHGTDIAKGEYIWFVDSDDFIRPNCLAELKASAEGNYDIINIEAYTFNEKLTEQEKDLLHANKIKPNENYWGHACLHLYKKSIIQKNNIKFNERIKYGEDEMFYNDVFSCSDNVLEIDKAYYFYRKNLGSAMNSINTAEKHEAYFQSVLLSAVILKKGLESQKYTKKFTAAFLKRRYKVCAHCLSRFGIKKAKLCFAEMKKMDMFNTSSLPDNSFLNEKEFKKLYKHLYIKRLPSVIKKKIRFLLKKLLPEAAIRKLKSALHLPG